MSQRWRMRRLLAGVLLLVACANVLGLALLGLVLP